MSHDFMSFFLLMAEYEKKLEDAVTGDTSGMFQRVLVSLLTVSKLWPTTFFIVLFSVRNTGQRCKSRQAIIPSRPTEVSNISNAYLNFTVSPNRVTKKQNKKKVICWTFSDVSALNPHPANRCSIPVCLQSFNQTSDHLQSWHKWIFIYFAFLLNCVNPKNGHCLTALS